MLHFYMEKKYKVVMQSQGSLLLNDTGLYFLFHLGHFSYSLINTLWENSRYLNILKGNKVSHYYQLMIY